jgi:hypothetical protein
MAQHQLAVVQNEAPSSEEALYDALLAALSSNARGRAFLEEYARRVRAEDTAAALAALARIEAMLAKQQSAPVATTEGRSPGERSEPGKAAPDFAALHPGYEAASDSDVEQTRDDLLAQVMALSPEERIALFS